MLSSTVPRLERGLNLGQSLFDRYPNVIVSTDFIKSARHREDFLRHCPDLVIVDEAHTCVAADPAMAGKQSQLRYELLRRLAEDTSRHLLLVTATPHSGKTEAFRNLLGLLRPELAQTDMGSEASRIELARHFVQRRRADIRHYLDQDTEFPSDRFFKDETYHLAPAYRALLDDAIAYAGEHVADATGRGKREARIAWWSAIALLRSLVSSPRAAAQTLRTRSASAQATTAEEADLLGRPLTHDLADDENLEGLDAAPGADSGTAQARLAALADRAEQLEGAEADRKLAALTKQLKALLKDGYHPIVFCRYIPTAEYVAEHLADTLGRKTVVRAVTGSISPQQRLARIEELADTTGEDPAARRVLVATDCLSEGVNLQHHFDAVVHYDLAWNPTRHDQREGRVDRFGQQRDQVRVITLYGSDNGIDGKVLEVLIKKHRQIRKDLGISVSVPDETATGVTDAIVEWLLMRDQNSSEQLPLFESIDRRAETLEADWNSTAERERASRSRFAQHAIHPDEVARELGSVRAALGSTSEVRAFVRDSLRALGADVRGGTATSGDFTAAVDGFPVGLRDALAPVVGGLALNAGHAIPFRTTAAVPRGEAALVRTDPVVGALAGYVLNAALDREIPERHRPARRCGVVRTRAVTTRTTLLLVRYRFHLTLPSRSGEKQLVAEDARLLAFEGSPASAAWLAPEQAAALLEVGADDNTAPAFAESTIQRVLDGLPDVMDELERQGDALAAELRDSHLRVREETQQLRRGLRVVAQRPADVLGVYVYLPATTATPGSTTTAGGAA